MSTAADVLARAVPAGTCLVWTGARQSRGYGSIANGQGSSDLVHRLVAEAHLGPIPEGMTVDHLCRNKLCVNPQHLELVTVTENSRRANPIHTTCLRGHRREQRTRGGRTAYFCRVCEYEQRRARTAARRLAITS